MAEQNYNIKLTLGETNEVKIALHERNKVLVAEIQRYVEHKQAIPPELSQSLADVERLLRVRL